MTPCKKKKDSCKIDEQLGWELIELELFWMGITRVGIDRMRIDSVGNLFGWELIRVGIVCG